MAQATKEQLELRAKLVAALRSGEYTQCRRKLFDGAGHCCLGVAARVAGVEPVAKPNPDWEVGRRGRYLFEGKDNYLPKRVQELYGFSSPEGTYWAKSPQGWYYQRSLAQDDNDNVMKPFAEIADIIESNPLGLWIEDEREIPNDEDD